jgi:hypothetical protein
LPLGKALGNESMVAVDRLNLDVLSLRVAMLAIQRIDVNFDEFINVQSTFFFSAELLIDFRGSVRS